MLGDVPKNGGEAGLKLAAMPQNTSTSSSKPSAKVDGEVATTSEVDVTPIAVEGDHLNTDEREQGNWRSRYSDSAKFHIRIDASYVAIVFVLTLLGVLFTWNGMAFQLVAGDCTTCNRQSFDRYVYFYLGGQFGGTLFGIKYLYNVVARGWWNIDRRLWRLFSPFLSGGLAVAVAALTESGLLGLTTKRQSVKP